MKLIIEDYPYKVECVERILQNIDALQNKDGFVRVSYVGYCYNNSIKDCVFFLPKVIINEAEPPRVLGKYLPEDIIDVSVEDRVDMCLKHLEYLKELKNEKLACLEIRNHIGWYFKGIKGSNELKNKVYKTTNIHDIICLLKEFKEDKLWLKN